MCCDCRETGEIGGAVKRRPILVGESRVPSDRIVGRFFAGDGVPGIAEFFEIAEEDVLRALEWELGPRPRPEAPEDRGPEAPPPATAEGPARGRRRARGADAPK